MPRLTKRRIDALPAREKEYFVWDDTLKGFGARVYPNGGKRYVAQTFRQGKTIRVQIGRHGALSFDEAKSRARKIIADIDEGRNPNKEKEAERLSPTVAELGRPVPQGIRAGSLQAANAGGVPACRGALHPAGAGLDQGNGVGT